jgi:cyclopropane-fatty-acyl-phospholipid synthase
VRNLLVDRLIRGCPYGGVRLRGWEEFERRADRRAARRADRIVCIGGLEHLYPDRYGDFFDFAYRIMPADGVLVLQTTVAYDRDDLRVQEPLTSTDTAFQQFLRAADFLGHGLPLATGRNPKGITEHAEDAGFTITGTQELGPHASTTLECWATTLHEHRERAIELVGHDTYNAYISYLSGCADYFRRGDVNVVQFTCAKSDAVHRSELR